MENNKHLAELRYQRDFYLKYKENTELIVIANAIVSVAAKHYELSVADEKLTDWAKEYVQSNGPLAHLREERDNCLENPENPVLQEKELQSIANAILFTAANKKAELSEADDKLIQWAGKYVHSIHSLAGLRMERDVLLAHSENERIQYQELANIAKSICNVTEGIPSEKFSSEDQKIVDWAKGFSASPDWVSPLTSA